MSEGFESSTARPHARFVDAGDTANGTRVGRYVVFRDANGVLHAVTLSALSALREDEDGCLLLLPGGRVVRVEQSLPRVLSWLEPGVAP